MNTYHKIPTVFKRDSRTNYRTLLRGVYSTPEIAYLRHNEWQFTEKVDGTNIRVIWTPDEGILFGGKTDKAQTPVFLLDRLHEIFDHKEDIFAEIFDCPVCLYGEGYGPKIQKGGGNYGDTQDFVLFDVKINRAWLGWDSVIDIAGNLGVSIVPVWGYGILEDMIDDVRDGIKSHWGNFQAEGLVARPVVPLNARNGSRIIAKLKTRDFCDE